MQTKRSTLAVSGVATMVLLLGALAGCSGSAAQAPAGGSSAQGSGSSTSTSTTGATSAAVPDPVVLTPSVDKGAKGVKVSTVVRVTAKLGTISKVKLWTKGKDKAGNTKTVTVAGTVSKDQTSWTANSGLDPASKYRLEMVGKNASDQATVTSKSSFTTKSLRLNEQTFSTIQPAKGTKVGIGMPVILNFDVPVKDRKEFEQHLSVTSTGNQEGTWSWFTSKSVHFRPKTYWKPGTKVSVTANLNGVSAGNGIYGQNSVTTNFTVGRSLITKVNLKTDVAKVYQDGKKVRTIPVTGGKAGWLTRSGTKLIMSREYNKVMTNEAIGAKEEYRLVAKYAMRVTNSGEFLHSAPWSLRNLGVRNASHGCVGMSIANSGWLYDRVLPGDPVITTGTTRTIEQGNGWTDWDISYKKYKEGSAL